MQNVLHNKISEPEFGCMENTEEKNNEKENFVLAGKIDSEWRGRIEKRKKEIGCVSDSEYLRVLVRKDLGI